MPDRIAVESIDGRVITKRQDPRARFADAQLSTPWDPLDRAYFNGYALWTYLTTPFLLTMPGVSVDEIDHWTEGEECWYGLRATFPREIATHSTVQAFYFADDHLLRRHDYHDDIAGGFAAAQYLSGIVEAHGFRMPTRRRAYMRDESGHPIADRLMVSIDLSDFRFS